MEFRFADPLWLALLAAVPVAVAWMILVARRRTGALRYSDLSLLTGIASRPSRLLAALPAILRLSALSLLILAMARPQGGEVKRDVIVQGVDIMLVLDCSGSMEQPDFPPYPNRLEAAKSVIARFIERRETDRIGLVVFGEQSFTVCPLTVDYGALTQFLSRINLRVVPNDGTAIGLGMLNALHRLRDSTAESKVIILITDGDNNTGVNPLGIAAQVAGPMGIKVYAIGIGPMSFPFRGEGVNPELLQAIAEETKGQAFFAEDPRSLESVLAEIDQLERSDVEYNIYAQWNELMAWLVAPALGLLAVEILLRQTRLLQVP